MQQLNVCQIWCSNTLPSLKHLVSVQTTVNCCKSQRNHSLALEQQLAGTSRGFHAQHPFRRNHFGWGRNSFCQTTDMAISMWSPPSLPSFLIMQNKDRNLKLGNNKNYQNVIVYRILKDFSFSNWRKDLILLVGEIEATGVLQSKAPPRDVTIPSGRWSDGKYIQELG